MSEFSADAEILVIDDDAIVREVLVEYLKVLGFYRITEMRNAERALAYIQNQNNKIDLILSDWEMPHLTGLDMLKAVRRSPQRKDTNFIIVTSQKSMERFKITQAAQWKVDAYIVKPFRIEVLRDKIWQVMGWSNSPAAVKKEGDDEAS